jgi:hypothetical protein
MAVSDQQIFDFFLANPDATDAQIFDAMKTYGISPQRIATATGTELQDIIPRLAPFLPQNQAILFGDTWVQASYRTIGSGESQEIGPLENIYISKTTGGVNDKQPVGTPVQVYSPEGRLVNTIKTKKDQSFFGGLVDALKDPVVLAALGGAAAGGLLSGAGTVAGTAAGTTAGTAAGTGLGTSLGTGLTAGAGGLGLSTTGAGLGSLGTGAGITAGTGLGTGVLAGSTLGTGLLGAGALTGAGVLGGTTLGTAGTGVGTVAGTGTGTGITAGAGGLGLSTTGAGLGATGTGAGITAGTGLTGTGVLTGSGLGTNLLGTTGAGALTGTGVLTGSTLGTQLLGTGAGTAATVGGLGNTVANLGTGALTTGLEGLSTGLTGLGTGLTSGLSGLGTGLGTGLTGLGTGIGTGLTNAALANLISTGLTTGAGLLQQQTSKEAAQRAQAMIDAETAAAKQSAAFRPIGMTTRFGTSQFAVDPVTGQLTSAGYTLSPEAKNAQDRLVKLAESGLVQAEGAQQAFAPLQTGAQALFGLGNQYLAQSPQDVAQNYLNQQMALLQPGRELELANLQNRLQQQGRGGLSVAQGGTLGATTPELQALYNARATQEAQLAAQAQQAGQQQVAFGAGLLGTGAQTMGQYYGGQQAAYQPYTTALGQVQGLEQMAQQPFTMAQTLAQQSSAAGARMGELGLRGAGQSVALATGPAATTNPYSTALSGLGASPAFGTAAGNIFSSLFS